MFFDQEIFSLAMHCCTGDDFKISVHELRNFQSIRKKGNDECKKFGRAFACRSILIIFRAAFTYCPKKILEFDCALGIVYASGAQGIKKRARYRVERTKLSKNQMRGRGEISFYIYVCIYPTTRSCETQDVLLMTPSTLL